LIELQLDRAQPIAPGVVELVPPLRLAQAMLFVRELVDPGQDVSVLHVAPFTLSCPSIRRSRAVTRPRLPIQVLTDDVGVPHVASDLLQHVHDHPAHVVVRSAIGVLYQVVQ
jgi:hypothetical protein